MTAPFPPDVVAAVCRHMDEDHRADALLICRVLGGEPDAVDAQTVGLDAERLHLRVERADGSTAAVAVPFAEPVAERAQVRTAVVELHRRACATAGLPVREH